MRSLGAWGRTGSIIGLIDGIFTTDIAGAEMIPQRQTLAIAGVGLEGDRYATGRGRYSSVWHEDRQATFISTEVLEEISAENSWSLTAGESRRNFATRGVNPLELVGVHFRIGPVIFWGGRENVPCKYLERLLDKPVFKPLLGRSGLNAQIVQGGVIRVGDSIGLLQEHHDV